MIYLFTTEHGEKEEQELIKKWLLAWPDWILHVRKPHWDVEKLWKYLTHFPEVTRQRMVVHYHPKTAKELGLKGWHASEKQRTHQQGDGAISTSFHSLSEARKEENPFEYFFCSPVFESISKKHHRSDQLWLVAEERKAFQKKAVALGGINERRLLEVKEKGFRNIALLGGVWQAEHPSRAFEQIYDTWQNYDHTV